MPSRLWTRRKRTPRDAQSMQGNTRLNNAITSQFNHPSIGRATLDWRPGRYRQIAALKNSGVGKVRRDAARDKLHVGVTRK